MQTSFNRRAALNVAAGACLAGLLGGIALAQPQPPPPSGAKPASPPPAMPAAPAAPAKNVAVPNAPSYPTEIGGRSLEEWIRDIDNSDPSVRAHAIQVIVEFGPSARKALPAITRQVKRLNDLSPQAYAIIALAELVPQTPGGAADPWTDEAVNALIAELENPEAVIRFRAATAIGYIGPPARNAVKSLIPQLQDRHSWEIRKAACFALGTVGRDAQGWPMAVALESLSTGVADTVSKDVRLEALQAIIRLGAPLPQTPLPRLGGVLKQRLMAERDKVVLIWVRVAMMALDASLITPPNVNAVAKELKSSDPELRVATARALALMGPAAKNTIQDLIDALPRATDPVLAIELCRALGRMGQFAERAIPSLETMDSQKDEGVKVAAKMAIADIKKAAELGRQQPVQPPK
jgi:HEAT repeat protein